LAGERLRLEPLSVDHAESLWRLADLDVLRPNNMWADLQTYERLVANIEGLMASTIHMPFAMVLQETGEAVGSSSFMDIRMEHKGLEIGGTWIGAPYQGTFVNPSAKFLMLSHAFENLGCIRVQLKTDLRNIQSQKAMEKLGCVKEGVLRQHTICYDGYQRSTVMYSILDSEWPEVRAKLEARISASKLDLK
jgi:RimJ/RimL family protein N-acetyltransferase